MTFPSDLPRASLWEMLAEEAVELAHEAQKIARFMRGDNPLGSNLDAIIHISKAYEEYNDLMNVAQLLDLSINKKYADAKMKRWISRLNDPDLKSKKEDDNDDSSEQCHYPNIATGAVPPV